MGSRSERWSRVGQELRTRIDSPRRAWLLVHMTAWWAGLACLRPLVPLKWLVRLSTPGPVTRTMQANDVVACCQWLDDMGVWRRQGACLPRALVCRRYLSLAGLDPVLLIGFNGEAGHAWVELDGAAYLERAGGDFRAALAVRPGSVEVERAVENRPGGL